MRDSDDSQGIEKKVKIDEKEKIEVKSGEIIVEKE
jgi:hypothetical protein